MHHLPSCTCVLVAALVGPNLHAAVIEAGDVTEDSNSKRVGDSGTGTLTIDNGSSVVETRRVVFGDDAPDGDGTGLVTGAGSSLEINDDLTIGGGGTGKLTVADGATVFTNRPDGADSGVGEVGIGQAAGSVGELIVTGTGSSFSADSVFFYMGGNGTGTLTVENNATFTAFDQTIDNPFFRVAQDPGGKATINVRTGGLLDATGAGNDVMHLPEEGHADVNIESGGRLVGGRIRVAQLDNSTANIKVTGAGSQLEAEDYLYTAMASGSSVDFDVSDGADVTVGIDLFIAVRSRGTLDVTGGSTINIGRQFLLGSNSGGDGEMLLTEGSALETGADQFIGRYGKATLTITDGASTRANDDFDIAWDGGVGVVTVTGGGSSVYSADRLIVAHGWVNAPSANGTLNVGRGALVEAPANNIAALGGFGLAIYSADVAALNFIIGDDGTGSIGPGKVEAGAFFFGAGTATLGLEIDPGVSLALGDTFTLVDYVNWDGGLFANADDDSIVSFDGYQFFIDYDTDLGGGDLALTATVVPEPTSLAMLGLGGVALLFRRSSHRDA